MRIFDGNNKGLPDMNRSCLIAVWIGLLMMFFAPAYGQKAAAMVGPLSHLTADGGDRVEISLNGGTSPNIFMIEGEKPRLVLDFPECGYGGSSSVPVSDGILVKGIRVGFHTTPKQKVRVVIDLVNDQKIKWTRDLLKEQNLLVISLFPAEPGAIPVEKTSEISAPLPVVSQENADQSPTTTITSSAAVSEPPVLSPELKKVKMELAATQEPAAESESVTKEPEVVTPGASEQSEKTDAENSAKPAASETSKTPVLLSVSFDNAFSQSGEMVLLQLSDFQPPVISTKEKNPPMIFCDFAGASVGERVMSEISAGGKFVEKIRVVGEGSNVRVSLDLVPGSNYDLQQVYFKEDNLFVLIVNVLDEKKG